MKIIPRISVKNFDFMDDDMHNVLGIGCDLIELHRVEQACERKSFINRVYTEDEYRLAKERISFLAGNFAAKEAVAKALGTGFSGFEPRDIEILRNESGKPYVNLFKGAKALFESSGGGKVHISISNTKEYAMAYALIESV